MIECKELANKVVRRLTVYEERGNDPEVHIEFDDGTFFSACLRSAIEVKYMRDEGGEPRVLRDYSASAIT